MLDGNSAAELAHDLAQMRAPDPEPYLARALDDVVDQVLRGERVPQGRRCDCIDLRAFIDEHIPPEHQLDDYVSLLIASNENAICQLGEQRRAIEESLRRHLEGSSVVLERAQELAQAARDDAEEDDRSEAYFARGDRAE